MKELLLQMFEGWRLHEASFDGSAGRYRRSQEDCMIEACGGDHVRGNLLYLFSYWSNDIETWAAFYGLEIKRTDSGEMCISQDVPPCPGPVTDYYWYKGEWCDAIKEIWLIDKAEETSTKGQKVLASD